MVTRLEVVDSLTAITRLHRNEISANGWKEDMYYITSDKLHFTAIRRDIVSQLRIELEASDIGTFGLALY